MQRSVRPLRVRSRRPQRPSPREFDPLGAPGGCGAEPSGIRANTDASEIQSISIPAHLGCYGSLRPAGRVLRASLHEQIELGAGDRQQPVREKVRSEHGCPLTMIRVIFFIPALGVVKQREKSNHLRVRACLPAQPAPVAPYPSPVGCAVDAVPA